MKYIELPSLTALASSLSHQGPECNVSVRLEAYSCKNIKRDKRLFRDLEKVYWEDMGVLEGMKYDPLEEGSKASSPNEATSVSPSHSFLAQAHSSTATPFGPLGESQSRKTLYLLISTLNVAFPDYTFDSVKPSSFVHLESGAQILNALSTTLLASRSTAYGAYPAAQGLGFGVARGSPDSPYEFVKESASSTISGTHPEVYALLDEVVGPLDECEVYEYVPEPEEDPNAGEAEEGDEEDYDFEDDSEEYVFALDEDFEQRSSSNTPREAAVSSSSNAISPFHESYRPRPTSSSPTRPRLSSSNSSSFLSSSYPPPTPTSASAINPLLWSSHWFFLNRKQKRVLYVSVWARKRSLGLLHRSFVDEEYFVYGSEPTRHSATRNARMRQFSESDESDGSPVSTRFPNKHSSSGNDRFVGWEGGAGAGARALGIDH